MGANSTYIQHNIIPKEETKMKVFARTTNKQQAAIWEHLFIHNNIPFFVIKERGLFTFYCKRRKAK